MGDAVALRLTEVIRSYGPNATIGPVSLTVGAGTCFGLIGANGAGKTTVMRMAAGLERPDDGHLQVLGAPVAVGTLPVGISGMIEEPRFYLWLSARQNLEAFCGNDEVRRDQIQAVLARVGLDATSAQRVKSFSQGMRQRLGIARVLLCDTEVVIFDEPTNGLDPVGIRWFREMLGELVAMGRTVLLSSHLLHEVQAACSHYLMLSQGQTVSAGAVADLEGYASLEDMYFAVIQGSAS